MAGGQRSRHTCPHCAWRRPTLHPLTFLQKNPFPGNNIQVGKYLPPGNSRPSLRFPPLSRNTRCLLHLSLLTYIFFLEPFVKPQAPPTLAGASPRSPHGQGTRHPVSRLRRAHPSCSSTPSTSTAFFSPPLEISKLRRGTFCASQSKQGGKVRPPAARMLLSERVVLGGGGREGVKRVINYPWMWKCD